MRKNILIFRSVVSTSMGYIVQNVYEKFSDDITVTIITRQENAHAMGIIKGVNKTICNTGNKFALKNENIDSLQSLRKNHFDLVIVPVNGQLDSYDNIIKYSSTIFKETPIYYHNFNFPSNFKQYQKNNLNELYKYFIQGFSLLSGGGVLVCYFILMIPFLFNKNSYRSNR